MPGEGSSLSMERVRELLSKKATFEEGVRVLTRAVESEITGGGGKRKEIVASVNRVASLLKTRYSSPGPWSAGLRLFEAAQPLAVADVAFRKQLQGHVEAAQEVVGKLQEDESPAAPAASVRRPAPYHFQGQLSVGSEPPPRLPVFPGQGTLGPEAEALLLQTLAQAASLGPEAFTSLGIPFRSPPAAGNAGGREVGSRLGQEDRSGETEEEVEEGEEEGEGVEQRRRRRREGAESAQEGSAGTGGAGAVGPDAALPLPSAAIESMLASFLGAGDAFPGLEEALEASLQQGAVHPTAPPASKKEVEKLPTFQVPSTSAGPSLAAEKGDTHTEGEGCTGGGAAGVEAALPAVRPENSFCTVCQEDWKGGDTIREMPCKHQFHVDCLQPWLDQHNSCPMCRYEMRTDDEVYERRKEREKEAEEERAGAANAVREGVYMYL